MKRWIVPLTSLSAVAGVIALTLFLAGVFDSDDASGTDGDGTEVAGVCAEDSPNCEDTLVVDGANDDEGSGDTSAPVCAPGVSDCVDTVVNDNEAGEAVDEPGGISVAPMCAPDFPNCEDMIVVGSDGPLDDADSAEPPAGPIVPAAGECSGDAFSACEEQAVNAALTDAQTRFGVDDSAIVVEDSAYQEWSNACLDAATDGEACAEIITPGFVIVLDIEGSQYEYHTDLNGNARLAE